MTSLDVDWSPTAACNLFCSRYQQAIGSMPLDRVYQLFLDFADSTYGVGQKVVEQHFRFSSALDTSGIRPDVMSIEGRKDRRIYFAQNVISLVGPNGVMPQFYSDYLADLAKMRENGLGEFLDLFVHRLTLAYLKIEDRHRPLRLRWTSLRKSHSRIEREKPSFVHLLALFGGYLKPGAVDRERIFFTGLRRFKNKGTQYLASFLKHHLDAEIKITEFHGQWKDVPTSASFHLGRSRLSKSPQNVSVLGTRMFTIANRIGIEISDVSTTSMDSLIPGGRLRKKLDRSIREIVAPQTQIAMKVTAPDGWYQEVLLGKNMFLGGRSQLGRKSVEGANNFVLSWTI